MGYDIILRDMEPSEADQLYALAKRSFSPIEALGASRPKKAVVAMIGDEVAGAMFLKIFEGKDGRKTGYLDLGFVVKKYRGKGVGNQLYPAAIESLKKAGCDTVTAMVKDDNVASWGLLKKHGMAMPDLVEMLRLLGPWNGLLLWLRTIYCIACGMNLWIDAPTKERGGWREFASYLLINSAFLILRQLLLVAFGRPMRLMEFPALWLMLLVMTVGGWIGAVISRREFRFRMNRGGLLLSLFLILNGAFFPMLGRWYPERYENTADQRQALGLSALTEWLAVLFIGVIPVWLFPGSAFFQLAGQYAMNLLIFHILAVYPFEYFGGRRVYDWNKPIYITLCIISAAVVFML